MEYEQITGLWQRFITHKIAENNLELPQEVIDFLQQARVDFMDIEAFDYLEYGQIAVRYLDFIYGEEEIEIRLVDSCEEQFEPQWGLMGKDEKKYFNTWLDKRFALNKTEATCILNWVETFLRAVLKKQAK